MPKAKVYPTIGGTVLAALLLGIIAAPNIVNAGQSVRSSVGATVTCVTDAQSGCTVAHSYGVKPDSVTVTVGGKGQLASVPADQVTASSYRVNFNWHTGATFKTGTKFTFQVHVDLPSSPTPSPSTTPSPTTATPTVTTPPTSPTTEPAGVRCTDPVFSTSDPHGGWSADTLTHVNNEVWNTTESGPQSIHVCSAKSWYVVANHPKPGADRHSIKSYPDTQKLFSNPRIGSFNTVTSTWAHEAPAVGEWNASYDIWLNNWNTELMIWTDHRYGGDRPAPLPPGDAQETATVTIDGQPYKAWRRSNGSYIALVMDPMRSSGSVDLKKVFDWLVSKNWLQSTNTLQAIDYGIEIADTGGVPRTFYLNDFSLTTN